MKKRFIVLAIFPLLVTILLSACGPTMETETPTSTPVIIYVPVTATAEPTQTETPTNTPEPPTATVVVDTPTPEILHFYVSGTVWHDLCEVVAGPLPATPPTGCVFSGTGGLRGNGIYETGEPGIAGITVRLEIDCSYGAFTTVTDANGFYSMSFTVPKDAGVTQQRICLSIDASQAGNASILIPGGWTYPDDPTSAIALFDTVIPVEQQNTFNFGWDYQFK